jgi:hypothetical protein
MSVPHFLPPARQHDRVNVERLGHRLNLDARQVAEFDGGHFEFNAVAVNFLDAWLAHLRPPSVS